MTAGRLDILFEAGTTWTKTIAWKDAAGTLVDTTGYGVKMQIRANVDDELPALEMSTANGLITVGRVNYPGVNEYNIKWSAPPGTTDAVEDFGRGVYDLEVTDGLGAITRLINGFCFYSPQVTRE